LYVGGCYYKENRSLDVDLCSPHDNNKITTMNPLLNKQKVDVSSLTPDEQRLFRLYGKLPNTKDLLKNKLKERKYFDSGDYALSKAGKASDIGVTSIGREHPVPENIPHQHNGVLSPGNQPHHGHSGSPIKESSYLQRETSVDDEDAGKKAEPVKKAEGTENGAQLQK